MPCLHARICSVDPGRGEPHTRIEKKNPHIVQTNPEAAIIQVQNEATSTLVASPCSVHTSATTSIPQHVFLTHYNPRFRSVSFPVAVSTLSSHTDCLPYPPSLFRARRPCYLVIYTAYHLQLQPALCCIKATSKLTLVLFVLLLPLQCLASSAYLIAFQ
jgi:hypothetical protein